MLLHKKMKKATPIVGLKQLKTGRAQK